MNKKYVIGILIAVLVVLAWFLVYNNSAVAPVSPESAGTTVATTTVTTVTTATTAPTTPVPVHAKATAKSTAPSAPLMTKSGAYIVSYTNAGFIPAMITIKRGKSVHFVNNSSKAMSIMDVDQTSQLYRQLNQEQSVGRGGYYDFSFVNGGIWTYTNRNNRTDRGTIIVE